MVTVDPGSRSMCQGLPISHQCCTCLGLSLLHGYVFVSYFDFRCHDNTLIESNLGRKGLFPSTAVVHHRGKSGKELKEGRWRQELKRRVQRNVAYCLNPLDLFILLSYTFRATFPRMEYFHINYQSRKYPTSFLQGRLMGVFP